MGKTLGLLMAGFGTVGQGLAELLLGREDMCVVGIADRCYGNVMAEAPTTGLDLRHALQLVRSGQPLTHAGVKFAGDVLTLIHHPNSSSADVLIEVTDSNFDTGQPAL